MTTRERLQNEGMSDNEIRYLLNHLGPLNEWELNHICDMFIYFDAPMSDIVTEIEMVREMQIWPPEEI